MNNRWQKKGLKHACHINREALGESTSHDWEMAYLDISSVDSEGNIANLEVQSFKNAPSRARRVVRPGDTVISTVRTYLKAIAHFENPPENLIASTGFAVLTPRQNLDSRFLWRAVQDHDFVSEVVANSEGVGYPAIAPSRLANLPIIFPELCEQRRIAAYLDEQTAKIDRLIDLRRRQIELLKEQRAAIIQQAVTRGLNPNAPMKDSGLPWLGEIPAHWDTINLGRLSTLLQTGPFGSQLHAEEYIEDGIPVINPSHMEDGRIHHDNECTVDINTAERLNRHSLRLGDIVFARRGELGRCALVCTEEVGWLCGTGSLLMRPETRLIEPSYLVTLFQMKRLKESITIQSVGSTMDNLNTGILYQTRLPLPPFTEQTEILKFIKEQRIKFDVLHSAYSRQLTLLSEYRAALIHECVTGQCRISEEV